MTAESTTIDETADSGLTEKAPAESTATENTDAATTQTAAEPNTAMIEAIGLSKFYGEFAASRNVNFKINQGEVVAFLGPNGAGKSTTMKLLTGFLAPSEGIAKIAGYNMSSQRIQGLRKLGYLPENGPLYLDMTPHSLLSFFADARGMSRSRRNDRIEAVVDLCDLSSVIYKAIAKLSKGYRQRVGMAQALLHEPDVLIMDEPTAGLDPNQIQEVRNTMSRLGKDRTILLSTHIMQEVEAMASRVIMINEGELVYDGAMSSLAEDGETLDQAFRRLTIAADRI
jgi:ABC-2 type transport system ATP-binding protein